MLLANEASYGKRALPAYHFENAKTIVSLGADFLGTWLSPTEFAKQYAQGRRVSAKNLEMSKHYHVEANHTITGAAADERATCKPSQIGAVAVALYNAIQTGATPNLGTEKLNTLVKNAAADLKKGNGLVVAGSNDVAVQTVVNAINSAVGANCTTVNWAVTSNYKQGIDADFVGLVQAMNAGQVDTLIMQNVNPVYESAIGDQFEAGLSKVANTITFASHLDETAQKCKYIIPDHHYLESWGDAEPKSGFYSLMQPGIAPIHKTRAYQDSLLTWAGATETYFNQWEAYWKNQLGGQTNFDLALQDGVIEPEQETMGGASFGGNLAAAMQQISTTKSAKTEVVVYEKISMGKGGAWSNNPWLQEMPDPISKATWDNYACVSPKKAKELQAELTSITEVVAAKTVIKIKIKGFEVALPLVVIPGMHNDVIAVALGYGRNEKIGRAAANTGKRVAPLMQYNGSTFVAYNGVEIERTNETYEIAQTQTHISYEGRPILHEYTLEEFKKNPNELIEERAKEIGHFASATPWEQHEGAEKEAIDANKLTEDFRVNGTLYPNYEHLGVHWGMSIDLNSCIGCGACIVGCQAENNISVVGKHHVLKSQEMHWIRIDRYFSGMPDDADSIQTVFQPMMCQHCDNAPCENVCPVNATSHSSEGLNQMTYNRCIGTKYCANNCPYKVRHFNWMDWNGADAFADNLYEDGRRDDMNDELTRMVLNPDVTVRSRVVMEKCSFCVQRLQEAKLTAKKAGRPLKDGEARTACQQACPTDAIIFGNVNDKESAIHKIRHEQQKERMFYVLEQIHTLPNVNYLSKIRNAEEVVAGNEAKDGLMNDHI